MFFLSPQLGGRSSYCTIPFQSRLRHRFFKAHSTRPGGRKVRRATRRPALDDNLGKRLGLEVDAHVQPAPEELSRKDRSRGS